MPKFRIVIDEYTDLKKEKIIEADTLEDAIEEAKKPDTVSDTSWQVMGGRFSYSKRSVNRNMSCALSQKNNKAPVIPYPKLDLKPDGTPDYNQGLRFICPLCDKNSHLAMPTGLYLGTTCIYCGERTDFDTGNLT